MNQDNNKGSRKKETEHGYIDEDLYRKIVEVMPIPCVDLVVKNNGQFLLCKRINKPAQGEWWPPGGRILKGESSAEAAHRKIKEEIGVSAQNLEFLTIKDYFFKDSALGPSSHSVNSIYTAEIASKDSLLLDQQHSVFQWFSTIDKKWAKPVREILELAGYHYENS